MFENKKAMEYERDEYKRTHLHIKGMSGIESNFEILKVQRDEKEGEMLQLRQKLSFKHPFSSQPFRCLKANSCLVLCAEQKDGGTQLKLMIDYSSGGQAMMKPMR